MTEQYVIDKNFYLVPTEHEINVVKASSEANFDSPESLFEIWLHYGISYGPQLIKPILEHFRTLGDPDMPENYINDVIQEFNERLELRLFQIKQNRFKLIKQNDKVAQAFTREINARGEDYEVVHDTLIQMGYKSKEISSVIQEVIKAADELDDAGKLVAKVLRKLNNVED